jgi:anti-anti-sigma factor
VTDPHDETADRLRVEASVVMGVARLAVFGELDLGTVEAVEARARALLGEQRVSRLMLDLRGATFLDSTGMRLLLVLAREGRRDGYAFVVVRGPAEVQRPLEIAGLDSELVFVDVPAQPLPPIR